MSELIRVTGFVDHGLPHRDPDGYATAQRSRPRRVRRRVVTEGGQTYTAYDAHSLLEQLSEFGHGRPGHLDE